MFRTSCVALFCAALLSPVAPAVAGPVVDRDEFSTTTELPGGKLKTSVSSQPVNFEASPGVWKAIDTTLEPGADGTVGPAAVDGDVAIPATLANPVELSHDGHELSVRLKGSSGGRDEVADAGAEFQDALAGVDVAYVSTPQGVKETLRLASASAPKVFSYDVRGAADWTAALDGGDVVLRDASGTERYRITAPLAWDSAPDPASTNALELSVDKVFDGRWTVTLRPDVAWLSDPARTMPVFIDPDYSWSNGTTHFHGAQDCYLSGNTQANNGFCSQTYLQTGYYNRPYRSIFKWDIASAIPSNATVSAATFKAYAPPQSVHYSANHSLTAITSDWDSSATWNSRKTSTPWTTAGGDISTNPAYKSTSTAVQASSAWYSWTAPVAAVQGWVNGTLPNYGLLLQTDAGAPANNAYAWASTEATTASSFPATSAEWPTLDVTWSSPSTAPSLTVAGGFVQGSSAPFGASESPSATFTANAPGRAIESVGVSVDGAAMDVVDNAACSTGCSALSGSLNLPMSEVDAGTHEALFEMLDSTGARTQQTVSFSRAATPDFTADVTTWQSAYSTALTMAPSGAPSAPLPAPPAAVTGDGPCATHPNEVSCRESAAGWVASIQAWLSSAPDPSGIPQLPAFPAPQSPDDLESAKAAAATAGMLRLAENIARDPSAAQRVALVFDRPQTGSEIQASLASKTAVAEIAFTGAAAEGGWTLDREIAEPGTVAAGLDEYFDEGVRLAEETIEDIEEAMDEEPGDTVLQSNLDEAEAALEQFETRDAVLRGASVTLNAAAAAGILTSSSNGSLGALAIAPEPGAAPGSFSDAASPPAEPDASAARSASAPDTCSSRGERNYVPASIRKRINPAYWAPSRFKADSFIVPNSRGNKGHRMRMRWNAPHSLAWFCSGKASERNIEVEARVVPGLDKWSIGWGRNRTSWTNFPGQKHYDDIADGDSPFTIPPGFPYDKPDYPDFAILSEGVRTLEYHKLYRVQFTTDKGDTGTNAQKGLVAYSLQAVSRANDEPGDSRSGERGYCFTKRWQYAGCMFLDSTVCTFRRSIYAQPHHAVIDWDSLYGTRLQMTTVPDLWDDEQGLKPCKGKTDESEAARSEEETEYPVPIEAPTLDGCETLTASCSVDPGQWPAGTVITYAEGLCDDTSCTGVSPFPHITWNSGAAPGGCEIHRAQITVVASGVSGVAYEPLQGPEVNNCAIRQTCNGLTYEPTYPTDVLVARAPYGAPRQIWRHTANNLQYQQVGTPGINSTSATWSPDRRRVVIATEGALLSKAPANNSGDWDVLAEVAADTSAGVACSPDGAKVAFAASNGNGGMRLDVVNLVTDSVTTVGPVLGPDDFSWSPDGLRIAYTDGENLLVVNADGTNRRDLSAGTTYRETYPHWAPDSQHIIFGSVHGAAHNTASYWAVRSATPGDPYCRLVAYEPNEYINYSVDVSPDGNSLIYQAPGGIYKQQLGGSRSLWATNWFPVSWGATLAPNPLWMRPFGVANCPT